jgi:hypothetical protein
MEDHDPKLSIRKLAKEVDYHFDSIRRMYKNEMVQYPRDLLNVPGVCVALAEPTPIPEPEPTSEPISEPTPEPVIEPESVETVEVCPSPTTSTFLNQDGNLVIHAKLPHDAKGTGTWNFDFGGKTYQVKGNEEVTYTAFNPPVGTYQVKTQFIQDDNGENVDLALCTVSVPTVTGGQLPNTATPWYNLLFAGTVLFLMGLAVWSIRKIS